VEALEALPGRPITGERVVGPDGTINLGFYGDVHVLGLNRDQIKVKVVEQLRKYINDESLGLIEVDKQGQRHAIAPAESSRVFVDDAILPGEPRTAEAVRQLRGQVKDLNVKLDRVLKELEGLRRERRPAGPPDAAEARPRCGGDIVRAGTGPQGFSAAPAFCAIGRREMTRLSSSRWMSSPGTGSSPPW
jgi:hypothetical protein